MIVHHAAATAEPQMTFCIPTQGKLYVRQGGADTYSEHGVSNRNENVLDYKKLVSLFASIEEVLTSLSSHPYLAIHRRQIQNSSLPYQSRNASFLHAQ